MHLLGTPSGVTVKKRIVNPPIQLVQVHRLRFMIDAAASTLPLATTKGGTINHGRVFITPSVQLCRGLRPAISHLSHAQGLRTDLGSRGTVWTFDARDRSGL